MDRLLLTGSISLLIIEIALLLGDLGFIPLDPFHLKENSLRQDEIGSVVQINQEVRRKSKDSLIWENSNSTDRLYAFDSILTLKNSFAKIELKNDIKLQLQENTLVVLEPSESGSKDHLRLRFARGSMRSKANKENLKIRTEEFTLEVGAESDIQLRSQGSDRFEMEVSKGEVKFQVEASSSVPSTIRAGEKVWLENSEVVDKRKMTTTLDWDLGDHFLRIYSHFLPTPVKLNWVGEAKILRIVDKNGEASLIDRVEGQQKTEIVLTKFGSFSLSLLNGELTSPTLTLNFWPAERITYWSPLPRDRLDLELGDTFSWSTSLQAQQYLLQLSESPDFTSVVEERKSELNQLQVKPAKTGILYWRILGIDDQGFLIPAFSHRQFYSVTKPLAAPTLLIEPSDIDEKIRRPANIKDTNKPDSKRQKSVAPKTPPPPPANSSSLNLPSDLFFLPFLLLSSKAMAEPPRSLPPKREVFAWNPVVGADFYIIEISKSQDFQNPLIVEKVPIEQFLWIPPEKVIYYWRVAAGQKSGRMGLFSPPAARDLTLNRASPQDLEKVQSKKELLPESNTLVTAPIPPPPLQRKEDQSPPKKEKKPTVLPPETVETESNPPTLTVRREPPMKSETEFAFFFAFVPEYNSWVQKKGSLNSKLEGWAAIATDLRLNMPHQEKGRSLIHAILSSSDWVRAEKADLPFQDDFSDWQGQLKYVYIPSKKNWTYGLVAHHSGYLMRVALEKVTWRQWNGFGASIGHLQTWKENTTWDSSITLIGASKLWLAEWSNQLDFSFPTWGMKLVAGPRFKIQYLKGEELGTSTRGQLGLQLGFEW